ncbi:hypothetical protein B0H66DRAFT_386751 [Apodospora peruviana]|uniref:Uncharacterized protein n=1 Tax=Apodospora peruviana TaxID=516989 RepID=A0AAE0LZ89_9PEZI|nr:hypothetical protein B0H66DRAFT_386751 [Apodospora peruviana]
MTGVSITWWHSTLPHVSVYSVILWPHRWWMKTLRKHMDAVVFRVLCPSLFLVCVWRPQPAWFYEIGGVVGVVYVVGRASIRVRGRVLGVMSVLISEDWVTVAGAWQRA